MPGGKNAKNTVHPMDEAKNKNTNVQVAVTESSADDTPLIQVTVPLIKLISMYMYVHVCRCMYMYVDVCTCMYMYVDVCTCTCMCMYVDNLPSMQIPGVSIHFCLIFRYPTRISRVLQTPPTSLSRQNLQYPSQHSTTPAREM